MENYKLKPQQVENLNKFYDAIENASDGMLLFISLAIVSEMKIREARKKENGRIN
jgi:hypothetical protein